MMPCEAISFMFTSRQVVQSIAYYGARLALSSDDPHPRRQWLSQGRWGFDRGS
jgi:hypothetical protein